MLMGQDKRFLFIISSSFCFFKTNIDPPPISFSAGTVVSALLIPDNLSFHFPFFLRFRIVFFAKRGARATIGSGGGGGGVERGEDSFSLPLPLPLLLATTFVQPERGKSFFDLPHRNPTETLSTHCHAILVSLQKRKKLRINQVSPRE